MSDIPATLRLFQPATDRLPLPTQAPAFPPTASATAINAGVFLLQLVPGAPAYRSLVQGRPHPAVPIGSVEVTQLLGPMTVSRLCPQGEEARRRAKGVRQAGGHGAQCTVHCSLIFRNLTCSPVQSHAIMTTKYPIVIQKLWQCLTACTSRSFERKLLWPGFAPCKVVFFSSRMPSRVQQPTQLPFGTSEMQEISPQGRHPGWGPGTAFSLMEI